MANIQLTLKRQATALAWSELINNATGERPIVINQPNGVKINWKPGQAKKMQEYLNESIDAESSPDDLNVDVDLAPVVIPLILKRYWQYAGGLMLAVYFLGRMQGK